MSLCIRAFCLGSVWIGLANLALSAIVVDDDFSTNKHPSNFRTQPAPGLGGIPFYTRYAVNVGTSSAMIQGGELVVDSSTANFPVIGLLPGTASLANVGDTITASFNFRFLNAASATDSNSSFRFGLHGSNGTPVTGDNQAASDNDSGYYVTIGDAPQTATTLMYRESGTEATITNGNDRGAPTATGSIVAITDSASHIASLTLTRNSSTTMQLSLTIDSTTVTGSFTTLYTSIDEISFANGFSSPTLSYAIDNLVIDASNFTAAVPEPSTIGLSLVGMIGFLVYRRRK